MTGTGEAAAYAMLAGTGDQLADDADRLLAALRSGDSGQVFPAAVTLERGVRIWRDARRDALPADLGPNRDIGQAFVGVKVDLATADTALSGVGPGQLDGARMVVLSIVCGMPDDPEAAFDAGELDVLNFVAPWPGARDALLNVARTIRELPA